MKAFNGDPASAARRPEALREETRRIRRVQRAVDLALQLIAHGELTRGEALRLMTAVRRYTLDLFPDKGGVFDLIYAPRLMRLYRSRFEFPVPTAPLDES
jgi:hypothetical protein